MANFNFKKKDTYSLDEVEMLFDQNTAWARKGYVSQDEFNQAKARADELELKELKATSLAKYGANKAVVSDMLGGITDATAMSERLAYIDKTYPHFIDATHGQAINSDLGQGTTPPKVAQTAKDLDMAKALKDLEKVDKEQLNANSFVKNEPAK